MKNKIFTFNRENIGALVLLELLSVSPLFMILGNILPPIGLKAHYYIFGIAFLASVYLLAYNSNKKWLFYITIFYFLIQPFFEVWSIKTLIDFFFGPFIILALSTIIFNKIVPVWLLKKYTNRFLFMVSIPLAISTLQFFKILPINLLEAEYVNFTIILGVRLQRPNGFLYHGSELAVMIYFMGIISMFQIPKKAISFLLILLVIAALTLYKAIFASIGVLLLYYVVFLDNKIFYYFKVLDKKRLFSYLAVVVAIFSVLIYYRTATIYQYTGYLFEPTLLTGRGSIWNIYLEGVKNFSFWNVLFGSGMGSEFSIFERYATPENFYPLSQAPNAKITMHTHNSLLSIFINSGIFGLSFIFLVFYIIYKEAKQKFNEYKFQKLFFAAFILPILLIGVTIPIFNKAIYWVMFGFAIIYWSYSFYGIDGSKNLA